MARSIEYADPPMLHRVRDSRLIRGGEFAIGLLLLGYGTFVAPQASIATAVWFTGVSVFVIIALVRFVRARGRYELRVTRYLLYLRLPDDQAERVVELANVRHLTVANKPRRGHSYYLMLRDSSQVEIPEELALPVTPLAEALHSAAPHVPAQPYKKG